MMPGARPANYRPDIDGLRAISILTVLIYHGFPSRLPGGFIGVDVFFVVSGYLITAVIQSQLSAGHFSFSSFYGRRVRRIFPALAVVLFFVWVAGWNILFPTEFSQLGIHIAAGAVFLSNFVLLGESGYFDAIANAKPLLHLWSLAVEEQFYLLWPVVLWMLWRIRRGQLLATLLLSILSFIANVSSDSSIAAFYMPQSRFWELGVGALIAMAQHARGQAVSPKYRRVPVAFVWMQRESTSLAGVALIGVAAVVTPREAFPGWWALIPVSGAALVILGGEGSFSRLILAHPTLVLVGLISYPLYLWHWPLISFAWIIYGGPPPASTIVVLIGASFALAWLTFVLIERPIRFGIARVQATIALVGGVLLIGGMGLVTARDDGFYNRSVARDNRQLAADLSIPAETRVSDGSCSQYFGNADMETVVVCLATSNKPKFLVIGDSHAMAMYSALYKGIFREDAVLVATHSGLWAEPECLDSKPFHEWLTGRSSCQDAVRIVLQLLASTSTIETVVFVTCQFNPFFANVAKTGAFQDAVLALHKRIVWLEPVPTLESPARCRPRTLSFLGLVVNPVPDGDPCKMPRMTIVNGGAEWTKHIRAMAAGREGVYIYDPLPLFCDAEYCHQVDEHGVLYWILGHLNVRGSVRLLSGFLPWLKEASIGPGTAAN